MLVQGIETTLTANELSGLEWSGDFPFSRRDSEDDRTISLIDEDDDIDEDFEDDDEDDEEFDDDDFDDFDDDEFDDEEFDEDEEDDDEDDEEDDLFDIDDE